MGIGRKPKVLLVAHVGETLGHLVRGLAVADELRNAGIDVEVACSPEAALESWMQDYRRWPIRWDWSHNEADPSRLDVGYLDRVVESNADLIGLFAAARPDLVLSFPGVFTAQAARAAGIEHVSVVHGPYLWPLIELDRPTAAEETVRDFGRELVAPGGMFDRILAHLAELLPVPELSYEEFLRSEALYVPQPNLPLPSRPNIVTTSFIRASFGPEWQGAERLLESSCYVTFGSGNPCDVTPIVTAARDFFDSVIVTTGRRTPELALDGVISQRVIASSALAGRVGAVISHGGIGTVGTFAEWNAAQLIIPTEIDQATMAVHATRAGIALECGLDAWAESPRLGRRLPPSGDDLLRDRLRCLAEWRAPRVAVTSSGAREIAAHVARRIGMNPMPEVISSGHRRESSVGARAT